MILRKQLKNGTVKTVKMSYAEFEAKYMQEGGKMCDRHHNLIRSLIAEIRALREELEHAEARAEERRRRSVAEYYAALDDERSRQWWNDVRRGASRWTNDDDHGPKLTRWPW